MPNADKGGGHKTYIFLADVLYGYSLDSPVPVASNNKT